MTSTTSSVPLAAYLQHPPLLAAGLPPTHFRTTTACSRNQQAILHQLSNPGHSGEPILRWHGRHLRGVTLRPLLMCDHPLLPRHHQPRAAPSMCQYHKLGCFVAAAVVILIALLGHRNGKRWMKTYLALAYPEFVLVLQVRTLGPLCCYRDFM